MNTTTSGTATICVVVNKDQRKEDELCKRYKERKVDNEEEDQESETESESETGFEEEKERKRFRAAPCKIREDFKETAKRIRLQIESETKNNSNPTESSSSSVHFERTTRLKTSLSALTLLKGKLDYCIEYDEEFGAFADEWDGLPPICKAYDMEILDCARDCIKILREKTTGLIQLNICLCCGCRASNCFCLKIMQSKD